MARFVGLDVSSVATGFAVVDMRPNGKLELVHTEIISTRGSDRMGKRLYQYTEALFALLNEYKPDYIIKEDIFSNRNIHSTQVLLKFTGVTEYVCYAYGIQTLFAYAPTTIKKNVAGDGRAGKDKVAEALDTYIPINYLEYTTDETDAIAAVLTHLNKVGKLVPRARIEEIESDIEFLKARGEYQEV